VQVYIESARSAPEVKWVYLYKAQEEEHRVSRRAPYNLLKEAEG
jgi:hypothetical protein